MRGDTFEWRGRRRPHQALPRLRDTMPAGDIATFPVSDRLGDLVDAAEQRTGVIAKVLTDRAVRRALKDARGEVFIGRFSGGR